MSVATILETVIIALIVWGVCRRKFKRPSLKRDTELTWLPDTIAIEIPETAEEMCASPVESESSDTLDQWLMIVMPHQ